MAITQYIGGDNTELNFGKSIMVLPETEDGVEGAIRKGVSGPEYFAGDEGWQSIGGSLEYRAKELGILADGTTSQTAEVQDALDLEDLGTLLVDNGPIRITGTINGGGKKLKIDNIGYLTGNGTLTNVIIDAPIDKEIFGPNLTVTGLKGAISPHWFGAKADNSAGHTDNLAAIQRALDASDYPILIFPQLEGTYFDNGGYYFSDTLVLKKDCRIIATGSRNGAPPTTFWFPADKTGIICRFTDGGGTSIHLKDILVRKGGFNPSSWGDTTAHGISIRTIVHMDGVKVNGCYGTGFDIYGYLGGGSNCNGSTLERCEASDCNHGFLADGPDANIIKFDQCSAVDNRFHSFYDNGFLGNIYVQPHAAGGGITADTIVSYSGRFYAAINKIGVTNLNKNPSTETEYWCDVTDYNVNTGYALPWDSTKQYYSGGSYYTTDVNANHLILNPYAEIYSAPGWVANRTVVINGSLQSPVFGPGVKLKSEDGQYVVETPVGGTTFKGDEGSESVVHNVLGRTMIKSASWPLVLNSHSFSTHLIFQQAGVTRAYIGADADGFRVVSGSANPRLLVNNNGQVGILGDGGTSAQLAFFHSIAGLPAVGMAYDEVNDLLLIRGQVGGVALNTTYLSIKRTTGEIKIVAAPASASGSYDVMVRNASTGAVEKVSKSTLTGLVEATRVNSSGSAETVTTLDLSAPGLYELIATYTGIVPSSSDRHYTKMVYVIESTGSTLTLVHSDTLSVYASSFGDAEPPSFTGTNAVLQVVGTSGMEWKLFIETKYQAYTP